jgi:hypothetical protein
VVTDSWAVAQSAGRMGEEEEEEEEDEAAAEAIVEL